METLSWSNFFFASRNSDASTVQPGVFAFGKKKSSTRRPLKSLSESCLPPSEARVNSGALSPILSTGLSPDPLFEQGVAENAPASEGGRYKT
jgi:hypothetical protein